MYTPQCLSMYQIQSSCHWVYGFAILNEIQTVTLWNIVDTRHGWLTVTFEPNSTNILMDLKNIWMHGKLKY